MREGRVARQRRALQSPNIINRGLHRQTIPWPNGFLSRDRQRLVIGSIVNHQLMPPPRSAAWSAASDAWIDWLDTTSASSFVLARAHFGVVPL
jgi:hypothetical protein